MSLGWVRGVTLRATRLESWCAGGAGRLLSDARRGEAGSGIALLESDSVRLVSQEAGDCGDCYLRSRVLGSPDLRWTSQSSPTRSGAPWSPSPRVIAHVWRQQVCHRQQHRTPFAIAQAAQCIVLPCHYVREAMATKIVRSCHIAGDMSPADILSKHWGCQQVWPALRPALFWQGDTMTIHHGQLPSGRQGSDRQCALFTD